MARAVSHRSIVSLGVVFVKTFGNESFMVVIQRLLWLMIIFFSHFRTTFNSFPLKRQICYKWRLNGVLFEEL